MENIDLKRANSYQNPNQNLSADETPSLETTQQPTDFVSKVSSLMTPTPTKIAIVGDASYGVAIILLLSSLAPTGACFKNVDACKDAASLQTWAAITFIFGLLINSVASKFQTQS